MAHMPMDTSATNGLGRVFGAALATLVGLTLINLVFFYVYLEGCSASASWKFCEFSKHFAERALAILLILGVYCVGRASRCGPLFAASRGPADVRGAVLAWVLGAALVAAPAFIVGPTATGAAFNMAVSAWALGAALMAGAVFRMIAPWPIWWETAKSGGLILAPLLLVGLFLPELGDILFPIWHIDTIRDVTFAAVVWTSDQIGLSLEQYPVEYILGQGDFFVRVNQSCSGIEGFVLITVFMLGYALIFARQVRVGRVLAMLPIALVLSGLLNVARIAGLIWLGVNVSPTLAVEGFHSHAGWLMFSVLSLGMMALLHMIPWFHKAAPAVAPTGAARAAAPLPPLSEDWNAARIVPFAVFMFSALLASTFFQHPALAYPLRVLAMVAALWLFRRALARLAWRVEPMALVSGLAIGIAWIATAPALAPPEPGSLSHVLAGLGGLAFTIWVAARIIGTSILVPVIEELFFRSYLLDRLVRRQSPLWLVFGVGLSTLAFAFLHDRWLAAALAGLIFAWLALRPRGRVEDAILSHMAANATIAGAALLSGNWAMI